MPELARVVARSGHFEFAGVGSVVDDVEGLRGAEVGICEAVVGCRVDADADAGLGVGGRDGASHCC